MICLCWRVNEAHNDNEAETNPWWIPRWIWLRSAMLLLAYLFCVTHYIHMHACCPNILSGPEVLVEQIWPRFKETCGRSPTVKYRRSSAFVYIFLRGENLSFNKEFWIVRSTANSRKPAGRRGASGVRGLCVGFWVSGSILMGPRHGSVPKFYDDLMTNSATNFKVVRLSIPILLNRFETWL